MKTEISIKMKATLGITGIAVALAGLAPPTAQAQECSAIQESYFDNLPGCVNPPATEEECRAFAAERLQIEYETNISRISRIQSLYDEAT